MGDIDVQDDQEPLTERDEADPDAAKVSFPATGWAQDDVRSRSVDIGSASYEAEIHEEAGDPGAVACSADLLLSARVLHVVMESRSRCLPRAIDPRRPDHYCRFRARGHPLSFASGTRHCLNHVDETAAAHIPAMDAGVPGESFASLPPQYTAESLRLLAVVTYLRDNAKSKRALGISHRPFEEGLAETLRADRARLRASGACSLEPC